jgi:hypothetical protein
MLFVSSYAVLFSSGTAYARAKSSLEQLVLASGGQVARVGLVWSAHSGGPVATLAKMSNLGYPLPIPRSRRVVVHLAHLDDVVQSLLGLAIMDHEAAASNPVSHLAHREPYDLVEVLSGLRSREGRLRTVRIPLPVLYTGIGVAHALRLLPLSVDHARGLFSSTATPDDLLGSEAFRPFDPATGGTRR